MNLKEDSLVINSTVNEMISSENDHAFKAFDYHQFDQSITH
jgi:hypothetical protein